MRVRQLIWMGCFALGTPCFSVSANEALSETPPLVNVQDWTGVFTQFMTRDGSKLSEYIAITRSISDQSADLWVSFVPRFACEPLIGLNLNPDQFISEEETVLVVDSQEVVLPVLVDQAGERIQLSYSANQAGQERLLSRLDDASNAIFGFVAEVQSSESEENRALNDSVEFNTEPGNPIYFSLLGSRATAREMRSRCLRHQPE